MSGTKTRAGGEENGSGSGSGDGGDLHLRPTDVICGRGRYSQHPGNLTFLSLVRQRKAAYRDAPDRATKSRLAGEVRVAVMEGLDPPGRFVQRLCSGGDGRGGGTARKRRRVGGRGAAAEDDDGGLYERVEEVQVMEKIKQALRQKVSKRRRCCVSLCLLARSLAPHVNNQALASRKYMIPVLIGLNACCVNFRYACALRVLIPSPF